MSEISQSSEIDDFDLIYDWNEVERSRPPIAQGFRLVDETMRDGIQSPSVRNPSIEEKFEILHLMEACGIENANIGLPGTGETAKIHVAAICREIRDQGMSIIPNCAARTHPADIQPIIEVSHETGVALEVCAFIGASPIRRVLEGWDLAGMQKKVEASADQTVKAGLPFSFVTEDTTRSDPETLRALFTVAIEHGATRIILTDTVGHATPDGLRNLVRFTKELIAESGENVEIDWHGHNDRGLAITLCLSALEHGVDRVHGTCLGVGERVGNASIDQLLVNLTLLGIIDRDLRPLASYVEKISSCYQVPVPYNYPVFGRDAFRTATGVHASAIIKAMAADRTDFADRVYSSVPAGDYGCRQIIEVGFCSGRANVRYWLQERNLEVTDARVDAVLQCAKRGETVLTTAEICGCLMEHNLISREEADRIVAS
jgi:2-isopropylmalate synthase